MGDIRSAYDERAALLEVVRAARRLAYVLNAIPEADLAPEARRDLRDALANLDRLNP